MMRICEDTTAIRAEFLTDVLDGLSKPQKSIPSRWLYDHRGSYLFDQITQLPEYYLARAETQILRSKLTEVLNSVDRATHLVEYGAGSTAKTRLVLDQISDLASYIPIDVSEDYLQEAVAALQRDRMDLSVRPITASFLDEIRLFDGTEPCLGMFLGSTIGNLPDDDIGLFLQQAKASLGLGSRLIIGFDLRKDKRLLIPAYDDSQGVTAAFNKNILLRANRELGANFNTSRFEHRAEWNLFESRIEMHLVSSIDHIVNIAGEPFELLAGETIHTENSRKFTVDQMTEICQRNGWSVSDTFHDDKGFFSSSLLTPQSE